MLIHNVQKGNATQNNHKTIFQTNGNWERYKAHQPHQPGPLRGLRSGYRSPEPRSSRPDGTQILLRLKTIRDRIGRKPALRWSRLVKACLQASRRGPLPRTTQNPKDFYFPTIKKSETKLKDDLQTNPKLIFNSPARDIKRKEYCVSFNSQPSLTDEVDDFKSRIEP